MDLEHGLWVLVADGEKALFLRNHGDADLPDLRIIRVEENELKPNHELVTDDEGRRPDSGVGQRSAMERVDYKRLEKEHFARQVAGMLERAYRRKSFSRVAVIAPGRVLGALRAEMHGDLKAVVKAEIDRDYTNQPTDALERRVIEAVRAA